MKPTLSILPVITVILCAFIIAQHFQLERMRRVCAEAQSTTTQAQALAAESLRLGDLAVAQRDSLQYNYDALTSWVKQQNSVIDYRNEKIAALRAENATLRAENEKIKVWLERGEYAIHPNSYYDTNFLQLRGGHAQIISNSVP